MSHSVYSFDQMTPTARDGNVADRVTLAYLTDTPPELLYFRSKDTEITIRRAVAKNPHTPRQADISLAAVSTLA
jgi:hypothetical protein